MATQGFQNTDPEKQDWLDALDELIDSAGAERAKDILHDLQVSAHRKGVRLPFSANTPYINTIPVDEEPAYPGDRELERRIKSLIRWNAMAMVVRANREEEGIGGHISSYQSIATLYEVGFNHFFRGRTDSFPGDFIYFQGHSSPGIYARAFLEGRLPVEQIDNFRHELHDSPGLSSYPHPWLMPDFWQFPTVSMGLGPVTAIYHARFIHYLEDRGLREPAGQKIWAFLGDGETDEPETLGALTLASREKLDNLIFVVNCNLQRLDGPVRGNGKVIQELEAAFRGAGWNVIKVVWGEDWDPLLAKDEDGALVKRMGEIVDGEYQKYTVADAQYVREHFFSGDERLEKFSKMLSDTELKRMRRGGHDPAKVYAAYKAAVEHKGAPTVILAKTVKGYGLGASGEGQNITHAQKKLGEEALREFRSRFGIPISDAEIDEIPFYRPPEDSPEIKYLMKQRESLGSYVPSRLTDFTPIEMPADKIFQEFDGGSERPVSTTMVFVRLLGKILKDPGIGKLIVPIVPDEARTFGMDALFRQCGIYSRPGQLYEPVDADNLLYYKEAKDGQILEEGITETGAFSSFVAAGTAYANHGINTIPFYIYYSMFGFQRIGDLAWLAGDSRCKGFLFGATAGRTTLAGEGLQHQDGNSHLTALTIPNMVAYDPAYAYELAAIIKDGIRRMYVDNEQVYYYISVLNENYAQPPAPEGCEEGVLKGMYKFQTSDKAEAQILGSGPIMNEAIEAAEILREQFGVETNIWSVTSYKNLLNDALDADRHNRLHPKEDRKSYVFQCLENETGPVIAASDYMKALPSSIAKWVPGELTVLGTDGFGRSDGREALRDHFEVDARWIAHAVLTALGKDASALELNAEKPNPVGE
ncbi:pyruvate dehydrogenase (acetyl-transferring), homodimeric type [Tichowtungia aerotolerans]|uniref:Pyruvate dehydrogenase E1 component n=1 Tax=Tichowtungia aerotolerans TaxID=2697043 RepID=A0A6P1MAG1_9BACT|nr:pyruvate dehydrogenase (acetyl-transferring), homodimeric type [Tichowtungia aerotolerans]QHI70083.1 pyruvate dehydrogenase (acetyl-transferring), homodimeric type [Tichowtungia aerotolerans]